MIVRSMFVGLRLRLGSRFRSAPPRADTTATHTVLIHGTPSGKQTTRRGADGRVTVEFSYRDNGRGPDVKEEIVLAPDGTQRSHRLTGKSTFGAPIDESYTRRGRQGPLESQADRGEATVDRRRRLLPGQRELGREPGRAGAGAAAAAAGRAAGRCPRASWPCSR